MSPGLIDLTSPESANVSTSGVAISKILILPMKIKKILQNILEMIFMNVDFIFDEGIIIANKKYKNDKEKQTTTIGNFISAMIILKKYKNG